ncbi:uncharacterized protein JCM6883_003839 [Sporobolomyces salmoneus]|uniref:uncharacterized protein n=1 Tax=Sporobolomyces salmoneus TaxID=183962 RepID=UPI0031708AE4
MQADADQPEQLFDIRPTRQGFLGAFASRPIKSGTLVLSDSPLFTVDAPLQHWLFTRAQSGSSGGPTPVEGEEDLEPAKTFDEFLERNIRQMLSWKTEEQRRSFWELANTRKDLPEGYGIFATNAVQTTGEIGGMFLSLSRLNSSCRPTLSRPLWDPSSRTTRLYALRDISEGEELTWTYLNVTFEFEGVDARNDEMEKVFGFACCCDACERVGMTEDQVRESEKRLMKLRRLKERIAGGYGAKNEHGRMSEGRRKALKEMALLSREEGLYETAQRLEKVIGEGYSRS